MAVHNIRLNPGDTAYVTLAMHPGASGCISSTLNLDDLLAAYCGPRVHLDFDAKMELIGVEILVFGEPKRQI
jgi:hypothetical protein